MSKKVETVRVDVVILKADKMTANGITYSKECVQSMAEQMNKKKNAPVEFNHKTVGTIVSCKQDAKKNLILEVAIKDCGIDLMNEVLRKNRHENNK